MKLIVYSGYSGEDSFLHVSQKAHPVSECEEVIQSVCEKRVKMALPIVYITRLKGNTSELYVDDLAFRLQGVAHVIYESEGYVSKLNLDIDDENDYLCEEFGDQLKKMEETNAKQNNEIQRLTAEIQGLRMKFSDKTQVPIIVAGEERDFYEGEIKEIVLEILEEYKKSCHEGSRRLHVIDDILQCNEYKHLPKRKGRF